MQADEHNAVSAATLDERRPEPIPADANPLHYTARAGLLAELSRQTYDSLYKALREAILNGIDAGATRVQLDFGKDVAGDELVVADDGEGMDLAGLQQSFMSLGGSAKYNDATKFGRIGIGSLALLTYASEAVVESKRAGQTTVVEAHLFHPQTLDRRQRAQALDEFPAGLVFERNHDGAAEDHFTRIRLMGLTPEVRTAVDDPTAFYALLDELRRVLPLPLRESRLLDILEQEDPDLVGLLREHAAQWSVPIHVRSPLHHDLELTRRTYGDGAEEAWSGRVHPVRKTLRVVRPGERREVVVAGFFVSQQRAVPSWSGLTARVQNVAVEERTFFDVTSDPGFRKYITGEVFLLGDVDADRLININRTSFNRESRDYVLVQRYVAAEIESFKRAQVSQPQRQKVGVRRTVEDYRNMLGAIAAITRGIDEMVSATGDRGLPSSRNGSLARSPQTGIVETLAAAGVRVSVSGDGLPTAGYRIDRPEGSDDLTVTLRRDLVEPVLEIGGIPYRLIMRHGSASSPPVIIKNRPREIVLNVGHPAVGEGFASTRAALALALEVSFLLPGGNDAERLYDRLLGFLGAW